MAGSKLLYKGMKPLNPNGRPKGSVGGRARTLLLIDDIFANEANRQRLKEALQKKFDDDPITFFTQFGIPLIPKEKIAQSEEIETTSYDTNDIVLSMDQATVPQTKGYRVRIKKEFK